MDINITIPSDVISFTSPVILLLLVLGVLRGRAIPALILCIVIPIGGFLFLLVSAFFVYSDPALLLGKIGLIAALTSAVFALTALFWCVPPLSACFGITSLLMFIFRTNQELLDGAQIIYGAMLFLMLTTVWAWAAYCFGPSEKHRFEQTNSTPNCTKQGCGEG